jgi:seryl-tRNA synthetase
MHDIFAPSARPRKPSTRRWPGGGWRREAAEILLALDEAPRLIHAAETAQAEQNAASKEVGAAKASGDEAEFERLRALVAEKKARVAALQAEAKALGRRLTDLS